MYAAPGLHIVITLQTNTTHKYIAHPLLITAKSTITSYKNYESTTTENTQYTTILSS